MSSQAICKACILLEGLNKGLPHLGTQRTRGKGKRRSPQSIELKLEEEQTGAPAAGATATVACCNGQDGCGVTSGCQTADGMGDAVAGELGVAAGAMRGSAGS